MSAPNYSLFADPDFDPSEYANTILTNQPGSSLDPSSREDVSAAITKLSLGIDDVSKQIKQLVNEHHEELLSQANNVSHLTGSLSTVRGGLNELDGSLDKLRVKIRTPYQALQSHVSRLQKLSQASDVLRQTARFVVLARRLQVQMAEINAATPKVGPVVQNSPTRSTINLPPEDEKERTIAKAALSIAELVALLDQTPERTEPDSGEQDAQAPIPIRSLKVVAAQIESIEESRSLVTSEMQNMVLTGLTTLDSSLLASSLQTAYNLRVLPELVQTMIQDLSQAVDERIKTAFDISKIVASGNPSSSPQTIYKSRVRTEPTNITAPQFASALWTRLESMIEEMADCCVKVYTLERVLKLKKDTASGIVFIDVAMELLENHPSTTFWTSLSLSLEKNARDAARSSTFLQQTLSTGYPRLLRLFHEFFAKISVHTDTVYADNHQSPETVLVLRGLSKFESMYLSRSTSKLNEAVAQAFAGGTKAPPTLNDAMNIARSVTNELDSAKFDPLLARAVAKSAVSALENMLTRADGLISKERSSTTLVGPHATNQQIQNAQVATLLYQCWDQIRKVQSEHSENVRSVISPCLEKIFSAFERAVEPLLTGIRRECSAIVTRLHRIDLSRPLSDLGGGSSLYMKDLVDKLGFIKGEIFSRYTVGEASQTWALSIARYVARTFVLHASIAKPLGESGKLQLTSDMSELEFALSALVAGNAQNKGVEAIGEDYRALRSMRSLLWLDNADLAKPDKTAGLPPLVVLHHIIVRSPVSLPHALHGWQEAEYVRWVDEHSEEEALNLVETGLTHWEQTADIGVEEATPYISLAQAVLSNGRSRQSFL